MATQLWHDACDRVDGASAVQAVNRGQDDGYGLLVLDGSRGGEHSIVAA